jgi:hypothetical protein
VLWKLRMAAVAPATSWPSSEPPAPDPDLVDPVAIERAVAGQRVRLTRAGRAEMARRVYAGRAPWRAAQRLGMSGTALRAAAESAVA